MRILVTFAIENEFAPWRELRGFRAEPLPKPEIAGNGMADVQIEPPEAYSAEIGGARVQVVLTGAGPKPAASAISQAIQAASDRIDFCISSGLAGALRPQYKIGQVLAAREVRSGDIGSAEPGDTTASSEALLSFASECGATLVEKFHTAGRVIGKAAEKRYLGETADAVEMESYVILGEARRRGVPAIAVRAISDSADENLPFDMTGVFTTEGRISMPLVLAQMAKHPQSIPAVMKLGQSAKTAATELAGFLDRYVEKLAASGANLEGKTASARPS